MLSPFRLGDSVTTRFWVVVPFLLRRFSIGAPSRLTNMRAWRRESVEPTRCAAASGFRPMRLYPRSSAT